MVTASGPLQNIPPPPPMAGNPALNRWLINLQQFISGGYIAGAGVNLASNTSFMTLEAAEATDAANITVLQGDVTTLDGDVTTINGQIAALQAQIAALPLIRNGTGIPATGLGNNGDLYVNNTTLVSGSTPKIYGKTGGTWYSIA